MTHPVFPELEGRKAVVTGGATGIGRAIVEALRRQKVDVALCDINPETAANTAAETGSVAIAIDVRKRASVEAAAAAAAQGSDAAAEAAAEALACRALQALVAAAAESSGTGVPAWLLLRLLMATEGAGAAAAAWIAEAQRSAGEDEGVADGHALEAACRAGGRFAVRLLRVVDCRGRLSSARAEEVAAAPSGAKAVPAADTPAEAAKRAACSFELEMPTAEELHQAASDARLL